MSLKLPITSANPSEYSEEYKDYIRTQLDIKLAGFPFEEAAVLVHVPQVPLDLLELEVARNRGYFAYPPQGLLYLSATFGLLSLNTRIADLNLAVLKESQHEDPNLEKAWQDSLEEALEPYNYPFVCISFMFDLTFPQVKGVCDYIRSTRPGVCIGIGGVSATADPERLLNEGLADLVFSHEGERTIESLYNYLRGQRNELPVNLSFLDVEGNLLQTSMETAGEVDLDIKDEYTKIQIGDYHKFGSLSNFSRMEGVDVPFAPVLSRRGCRARCSFCGVRNFNGANVRVRDVDGVVAEMEHLHKAHGINHFDWLDDDLLFDRGAALELFGKMSERLPDITWEANNGLIAAAITPEIMDAMQDSGCMGFKIGLESGNATVLRQIHKPTNLSKFYTFAELSHKYPKMFVAVNFILGFPDELFEQQMDSFKAALKAKLDWNNFYMYQHIKNTELYKTYGGLGEEYKGSEHGKDNQEPYINPVRAGAFKNYQFDGGLVYGYDVIEISNDTVPYRDQLKEIWFTFNYVANFLRMPALITESEVRLKTNIRWLEVLSQAYPDNPAMSCVIYYLKRRLTGCDKGNFEQHATMAKKQFSESSYWQDRDAHFNFSAFLDNEIPSIDPRYSELILALEKTD